MYSYELKQYIDERNGQLTVDEIFFVLNHEVNPQIDHIVANNSHYDIWDYDGNYYSFTKKE